MRRNTYFVHNSQIRLINYTSYIYSRGGVKMKAIFIAVLVFSFSVANAATLISGVAAQTITQTTAEIAWSTSSQADSRVNYGLTTSYGNTARDLSFSLLHRIRLTNLKAGTVYNYRVRSKEQSTGQLTTSGNFTFKTLDAVVVAPPPPPTSGSTALPAGTSWYWQLQGAINMTVQAKVYDIDLFDVEQSTFTALKLQGHQVICYFSAGTYENWRSDASQFPTASLGNGLGWPGEKWLDVRNTTVRQIMVARMDLAKSKGCDGLEPDNVDGYANNSGFNLTQQDQVNYLTFLADQAHARGMTIALKNATDLVGSLVSKFDFAVVEECFKYNECEAYSPFIAQNKAVLNAEYSSFSTAICTKAKSLGFSTVFFNLDLDGRVYNPCP